MLPSYNWLAIYNWQVTLRVVIVSQPGIHGKCQGLGPFLMKMGVLGRYKHLGRKNDCTLHFDLIPPSHHVSYCSRHRRGLYVRGRSCFLLHVCWLVRCDMYAVVSICSVPLTRVS